MKVTRIKNKKQRKGGMREGGAGGQVLVRVVSCWPEQVGGT